MLDEIKTLLNHEINQGRRIKIERLSTIPGDCEQETSLISRHVASQMQGKMKKLFDETDGKEAESLSDDTVRNYGGLQTKRQFQKHLEQKILSEINTYNTSYNITVQNGSRVFGPPYDLDWSEGNGVGAFSRFDGKVFSIPKTNAFSAAGIGFYLTTNEPVLASIIPQGNYDWSVVSFQDLPFARSSGGLGITIYTDAHPQPTLSRQPVLWSMSGIPIYAGQKGSGRIADAASPAFGFGTVPLAPVLLNMVPGAQYLVWVWCWQTFQNPHDASFIAFLSFSMPFVTVDAGPPIVIH